jgi:SAM-dependent methyltransferase
MTSEQGYIRSNQQLWDRWTELHVQSDFYDVPTFKLGGVTLQSEEVTEVGDVAGKSLLHLQCHFGQDTLSWARLGATVTGADFSPKAIDYARTLAAEIDIDARFVCADLYDLPEALRGAFDIVYTGGGAIYWLPDLNRWGKVVSHFLKPGGTFYIRDFHPVAYLFDDDDPALKVKYPYFPSPEPLRFETHGSYAAPDPDYLSVEHGWVHSMGEIINAVTHNGMRLEFLNENAICGFQMFPFMEQVTKGRWALKDRSQSIPFTFSLKATKE